MSFGTYPDQNHPLHVLNQRAHISIAAAPTADDDADSDFGVGSRWIDTSTSPPNVYECVDASAGAAVWKQINRIVITTHPLPLDAAGVFYVPLPVAGRIASIRTAVSGTTTTTGAATVTAALDTTDITGGAVTIAIGAVVGEKDSATPSAANVATAGQNLRLTVAPNSQDAVATAIVSVEIHH